MTEKKVPHKHAALIKAWADGAQIQYKNLSDPTPIDWADVKSPTWRSDCDYRVKPEPKPDVVLYAYIIKEKDNLSGCVKIAACYADERLLKTDTCMFIFDGETGKLKDAQVLTQE